MAEAGQSGPKGRRSKRSAKAAGARDDKSGGTGERSQAAEACRSQRQLAQRLAVSRSTVAAWVQRPDFPAKAKGPWSEQEVQRIQGWRAQLQEDRSGKGQHPADLAAPASAADAGGDGGGGVAAKQHQIKALHEYQKYRKAKLDADRLEGKLVDRQILDQALAGLTALFVEILENLEEALPHKLDGDRKFNEGVLRDQLDDARRRIIDQGKVELTKVEDRIEAERDGRRQSRGRKGKGQGR